MKLGTGARGHVWHVGHVIYQTRVKFNDQFLLTVSLERNFSHFSMILPLDFSEILNICHNYSLFYISAHFMM